MSAAIGGRSEGIGAAPDRSAAQTTSNVKVQEQQFNKEFNKLSQEEKELVVAGGKFDKIPFGAQLVNLFARKNLRQSQANKFISAPSGANVDRKEAAARVAQLDQVIAEAKAASDANNADRSRLEQQGLNIFSGSPLDLAFSNKAREFNNIISRAQAEKQGIGLQTSTEARKAAFDNFTVVTDKRNGKGRLRGLFDPSGRGGLSKAQAEAIQKQNLPVADLETAKANQAAIIESGQRIPVLNGITDGNAAKRYGRAIQAASTQGVSNLQEKRVQGKEAAQFTDQLLSEDSSRQDKVNSKEFAEFNAPQVAKLDSEIALYERQLKQGYTKSTGKARRIARFDGSGRHTYGNEAEHWANQVSSKLQKARIQRQQLTQLSSNKVVKVADNQSIQRPRAASLFEALGTLNRVLSLPQNSGDRGANSPLKAKIGALNKVQNQRIQEQGKSQSRQQVKLNFEKQLNDINANGELNQKQKKNAIFQAARQRDESLKGKIATNTQFEQSRAGFAASRTNIVSGHTVRSVQDFIDLGRKKRRIGRA